MVQHETTRRALLGGAGLAVSAVAVAGVSLASVAKGEALPAPTAAWDAAMARLQQADAAFEAVKHDDDLSDDALDHYGACQWEVMETPAPNLKALKWKLDYLLEGERGSTASWGVEYVRPVRDDIARFAAREA